jgi:hypothetical protein
MSACARCGSDDCSAGPPAPGLASTAMHIIECRDRQIAAQAALLRSVTGKLEEAHDMIDGVPGSDSEHAKKLIASVLEALS